MDDYINREDAIKWLKNLFDDCGNYMPLWHYGEVLSKIIELLEVDVAPVRHGRWIYHMDDLYPEESTMECSVCGDFIFIRGESDNYCPNCGAKMDGEIK